MYPPKLITYNVQERTSTVKAGCFKVDVYETSSDWLYLARPLVDHPYIAYLKVFTLPELGIQINKFFHHDKEIPRDYTFFDYYIDIGDVIEQKREQWIFRDLYLDVVVIDGKAAQVLDTNDYLQAVEEKLVSVKEAAFALETTHTLLNALAENNYSLESYLQQQGIAIDLARLK